MYCFELINKMINSVFNSPYLLEVGTIEVSVSRTSTNRRFKQEEGSDKQNYTSVSI